MRTYYYLLFFLLPVFIYSQNAVSPCDDKKHEEFDFWVGDWEVYSSDGKLLGKNRIRKEEGGCVLIESYQSTTSVFSGRSYNFYNPDTGNWEQLWLDNQGTYLHLYGELIKGAMVLQGEHGVANDIHSDRITWTPLDDGRVRQLWERRKGEEKWQTLFDGYYTKSLKK